MATNLAFNVAAFDKASATFLKVAERVERLADKLDELDRKRANVNVDVDTRHAERNVERLSRKIDIGISGSIIKVVALGRALAVLSAPVALAGMVPMLANIAAVAAQAAGALGLIPAAVGAAGLALGTLAVGFIGLKDAFKPAAGATSAVNSLASAAKAADRARVQGAEQVRSAEQALTRAQQASRDAQVALTRARKEAAEQLEDLRLALSGAGLDERAAVLSLKRAQERLNEVRASGAKGLDLEEAVLGVDQANQALKETRERYADLKEEAAAAEKAGINGAEGVIAAQRQVADATQGVEDAQRNLAKAQREAAQAQQDAAEAMVQANKRIADTAPPALAAAAAAFVAQVKALEPAFTKARLDVQQHLFAGIAGQTKALAGIYLPMLRGAMVGVADSINRGVQDLARFFRLPSTAADVQTSLGNMRLALDNIATAARPLAEIWNDFMVVGSEFLPGLTRNVGGLAESFADFIHQARESGRLKQWIQDGLDTLKQLGAVAADALGIIRGIFRAAGTGAQDALGPVGTLLDRINAWVNSVRGQNALSTFFQSATRVIDAFLPILAKAADIVGTVVAPAIADFAEALAPGIDAIVVALGDALRDLAQSGALTRMGQALSGLAIALAPLLPDLAKLASDILVVLAEHVIDMTPQLDELVRAFLDLFREVAPVLPQLVQLAALAVKLAAVVLPLLVGQMDGMTAAIRWAKANFEEFIGTHKWLADVAKNIVGPALDGLIGVVGRVRDAFREVGRVVSGVWDELKHQVVGRVNEISTEVRKGVNRIIGAWNWVADKLHLPPLEYLDVFAVAPGRNSNIGLGVGGFATGGPVRGGVPGRDSVPAMLMPDEFVLSRRAVENLGGIGAVGALHQAARQGRSLFEIIYGGDPSQPGIAYMADGGAVARVQEFGRAQAGKPYIWGGVGPRGFDCSGLASVLTQVALGRSNVFHRLFSTASFTPNYGAGYFRPGLNSAFSVGVFRGNPGHMATTVGGLNIEATPPVVRVGPSARGADHPSFTMRFSLPQVGGNFIGGGGPGGGGFDFGAFIRGAFDRISGGLNIPGFGGGAAAFLKALSSAVMGKLLREIPGFGAGGVVPGAYGSPQLATVHGGEFYSGMDWERRLASAIIRSGGGSRTYNLTIVNAANSTVELAAEFRRLESMSGF